MGSWIDKLPKDAELITRSVTFTADYNTPTVGKYDFNVPANQNVDLFRMNADAVYLFARISFGADIPEVDFSDVTDEAFNVRLYKKVGKQFLYRYPLTFPNYTDEKDVETWFDSQKSGEVLQVSAKGLFNMNANLVGKNQMKATCTFDIYQVKNKNWVRNFLDNLEKSAGTYLRKA